MLEKENLKLLEKNGETNQSKTKTCVYGLATMTSTNRKVVERFIDCMYSSRRIKNSGFSFKIICEPSRVVKNCSTFYVLRRKHRYDCQEVCWDITFPYETICNKKPTSYTNTILGVVTSLIILALVFIWSWRKRKILKVSYLCFYVK